MSEKLHVLLIEDSETDAEMVVRLLEKSDYELCWERVETAAELRTALAMRRWDVILSDYSLPQFNPTAALAVLQESGQDIPFIVLSGTIDEETAVALMKAGAHDYLLKDNLIRLAPSVARELAQARIRQERTKSEERHRRLFAAARTMVVSVSVEGVVTHFDSVAEDITGYKKDEMRGRSFVDRFIPDDEAERFNGFLNAIFVLGRGEMRNQEFVIRIKAGFQRHMILNAIADIDNAGTVHGATISALDITPLRMAEQARITSEKKLNEVLSQVPVVLFSYNLRGELTHVTDNLKYVLGVPADKARRSADFLTPLVHPEDRPRVRTKLQMAFQYSLPFNERFQLINPENNRTLWMEIRLFVMRDAAGRPLSFEGMMTDITTQVEREREREKLLSELEQGRRFRALGQMAGGIAHDFNNLFGAIVSFIDQLFVEEGLSPRQQELLGKIVMTAERAGGVTGKLLSLVKQRSPITVPVDLHAIVEDVIFLGMETFDRQIIFEKVLRADAPRVLADPGELEEALLNLALNARDAMPDGGIITVSTRLTRLGVVAAQELELQPGEYVEIAVADTGIGMPPEVKERLFEPFFTTKSPDAGIGLGLAGVFSFAKACGGGVSVQSELGRGSVFTVFLPVCEGRMSELPESGSSLSAAPAKGRGRLLLADDEPLVREPLAGTLRKLGYEVVERANGAEAVACYEVEPQAFDVVILDMLMPAMNGLVAFRRIRTINPTAKVVVLSGFTQPEQRKKALDEGVAAYVSKPVRIAALAKIIEGVIEGCAQESVRT